MRKPRAFAILRSIVRSKGKRGKANSINLYYLHIISSRYVWVHGSISALCPLIERTERDKVYGRPMGVWIKAHVSSRSFDSDAADKFSWNRIFSRPALPRSETKNIAAHFVMNESYIHCITAWLLCSTHSKKKWRGITWVSTCSLPNKCLNLWSRIYELWRVYRMHLSWKIVAQKESESI